MSGFTERSPELPLFVRTIIEHDHSVVSESTEMFQVDSAPRDLSTIYNVKGFLGFLLPWFRSHNHVR